MWGTGLRSRVEAAEKRLAELEDAYERVTALEAEWQDWLHKIRNVLARLNSRARAAEEDEQLGPAPRRTMNPAAARLLGLNGDGP